MYRLLTAKGKLNSFVSFLSSILKKGSLGVILNGLPYIDCIYKLSVLLTEIFIFSASSEYTYTWYDEVFTL